MNVTRTTFVHMTEDLDLDVQRARKYIEQQNWEMVAFALNKAHRLAVKIRNSTIVV